MDNVASTKTTLMNSFESLQNRTNQINDLARLSQRIVDKFNRTDDRPTEEKVVNEISEDKSLLQPNIMDLFNRTSDQMEKTIKIIRDNLEDVMSMID